MKKDQTERQLSEILVTAATGKTGSHVVKQLIEQGVPVRALVHREDERSDQLKSLGAEVIAGDYFDIESLRSVMKGIKRAYFCYPPTDGLLEASTNFAVAGKEIGLESVVNISQMHAREGHPSSLTRQHWLGEKILDWAGIGATHLRCTFFAEAYLMMNRETIITEGKFYLPHGDGKHAPVTCEDIARVIVGVLLDPRKHIGKTYTVTGPKVMSQMEIAEVFSYILKKQVEYVAISLESWKTGANAIGLPPFLIEHLSYAAEDYKKGLFANKTDTVEKVCGQPPTSFDAFVSANAYVF